jgi:hypothetical protein
MLIAVLQRSRQIVMHVREDVILRYAVALFVHGAQVKLCVGVTLVGSAQIPLERLGIILRYAQSFVAILLHRSEIELRGGIVSGGDAVPLECLSAVLRNALAEFVHEAEFNLRLGVTLLSKFTPKT